MDDETEVNVQMLYEKGYEEVANFLYIGLSSMPNQIMKALEINPKRVSKVNLSFNISNIVDSLSDIDLELVMKDCKPKSYKIIHEVEVNMFAEQDSNKYEIYEKKK